MPPRKSAKDFFSRARERGPDTNRDIVNMVEVKREVQWKIKDNYNRALGLWY